MMPTVRSVMRAAASAGSRFRVSGSTSAKTGLPPRQDDRLGGGEEAEGGDDHLVAGLEVEGAQGEDQGVGAVGERRRRPATPR